MSDRYRQFLEAKAVSAPLAGFDVDPSEINPDLKDFVRTIVAWAAAGGQRAIFSSFGLHKTSAQIELARLAWKKHGALPLIVVPLGVRAEFMAEAEARFRGEFAVEMRFIRTTDEIDSADLWDDSDEWVQPEVPRIYLTNYESVREGKLDVSLFGFASLDEGAVLRSYGSKTFQEFLPLFAGVRFKVVATAVPSPNRTKELIHYAGFLGVMDTGLALTRWFQRNSEKANDLQLYPHKAEEFWQWVATWAVFVQKPSDLGFSDEGYDLPEVTVTWHEVPTDHSKAEPERDGQGVLLRNSALGITQAAAAKRDSLDARIAKMLELIAEDPDAHRVLWHDLEDERRAIEAAVPGCRSIYGAQSLEANEAAALDFKHGRLRDLAAKPVMSGAGPNWQGHCAWEIFLGVGYKFHDLIQAVHRVVRFGQTKPCRIDIIYSEAEREVRRELERKWGEYNESMLRMRQIIREFGLGNIRPADMLRRSIGVERQEASGAGWTVANNDCVVETSLMEADSVGLIVTSIPFCYDETTEVLTRRGWLTFDQVGMDDDVATVHPHDLCLEWQRPTARVWQRYDGEMLHFIGRSFDHLVTPNHRMFAVRRGTGSGPDRFALVDAETIASTYEQVQRRSNSDGRIQRGWKTCLVPPRRGGGDRPDRIFIPALPPEIRNGHGVHLYWIETEDFARLAGWYLSEGHADPFDTGRCGGRISIGQTAANQSYRDEIEAMFLRIGLPPSMHPTQLSVWCRNLAWFLQQEFGHGSGDKRIPRWVKDLHPDLLEILRDTMMKGDGSKGLGSYASISRQLRDDFQEVCLATGWRAALTDSKVVNVGQSQLFPEIRCAPKRVTYSGMIGCLTVPNHTLIVRRNGKAFVSGNSNHYEYVSSYNDFGHTDDNRHFWAQMDYLAPELFRVLQPGRLACIHVKDRVLFGNVTGAGAPTVSPFHAEAIFHYLSHGFDYMGLITIVTDVVRENNGTYRLGYTEMLKDGTKMGVGSPEYVVLLRKPQSDRSRGYADVPVVKDPNAYSLARWQIDAHAFWRSSGNRLLTADELVALGPERLAKWFPAWTLQQPYDHETHVALGEAIEARRAGALPRTFMALAPASHDPGVWHDVNRMRTLNADQVLAGREKHVCPLQLDIIERLVNRYSNAGDLIYDPFGGLFSVPYTALKMKRRGRAAELHAQYFRDGVRYLQAVEREMAVPTLFDLMAGEAAA